VNGEIEAALTHFGFWRSALINGEVLLAHPDRPEQTFSIKEAMTAVEAETHAD
jgi:hypothetical protein